jgi:hypothetical protein
MFDREFIGAWDLQGRDFTVTIAKVVAGNLTAPGGRKAKKPIVHIVGAEKAFILNKTNAKTIASLYGNDTAAWVGKQITIYATKAQFGSEMIEAIRVRPVPPAAKSEGIVSQPVNQEMREAQNRATEMTEGEP